MLTVPNLLCLSRIAAAPLLAHLIIEKGDFGLALAVFAFAGATDMVNSCCSLQRMVKCGRITQQREFRIDLPSSTQLPLN